MAHDPFATAPGAALCPVSELGVLLFEGDDALAFLQGQLSSDVVALAPGDSQWSTYNSPKGRVLANMRLWREPDAPSGRTFGALVAADLAGAIAKRLAMFVLRAKVAIAEATGGHVVLGVAGPGASAAMRAAFDVVPAPDKVVTVAGGTARALALPDGRYLLIGIAEAEPALRRALAPHTFAGDGNLWRVCSIQAGIPLVTAATTDHFVLQMLNFDALGGVSFQKGCYPGQEVVARTRYLGRLKERLYGFRMATAAPASGARLYSPAFGDQPCGTVVNAATNAAGDAVLLAVVQIAAVESGGVAVGAADGPVPEPVALPYAVETVAPQRPQAVLR